MSNWRFTKDNFGVERDGVFVRVGLDSPRWVDILASRVPIDPYVQPDPPTPAERRRREYRRAVDEWTIGVTRYQVMLALIPDTPETAARRTKIQQKLTAARQTILDLVTAIENSNKDA